MVVGSREEEDWLAEEEVDSIFSVAGTGREVGVEGAEVEAARDRPANDCSRDEVPELPDLIESAAFWGDFSSKMWPVRLKSVFIIIAQICTLNYSMNKSDLIFRRRKH